MQQYFLLFITVVIIFLGSISCTPTNADCVLLSNKDCGACLNLTGCAFCITNKSCFLYDPIKIGAAPCSVSDMQWETCVGTFKTWIIIVSVVAGILLIAILIAICCVCRKCKRCSIRREEKRQAREQDVENRRAEDRRAAADVRSTERNRVADEIRMKYGILKEKENGTDYTRMN
ncbi:unnamed protein product [Rotaria magnacalcarata]|uniref:Pituitary tumor-transforming gene 1 protein-interacting protein n=1 Tax=Rotaria magnacalcarata TaxID=392030 RepID=A0A819RM30_9BILA|nr:unnamed protein product [Rotaria magnacalcarata]CAF1600177.1 unnamed protein product [Rotaria magnacalcarata]CAF2004117.1 unnamed protein product [Rotaria magnacalcarata]CAF2064243.1 unnamed protein product [Rotaria magnacalcarata]CAF2154138.1 unnamed protein product [Rotaria magnacalcarata]